MLDSKDRYISYFTLLRYAIILIKTSTIYDLIAAFQKKKIFQRQNVEFLYLSFENGPGFEINAAVLHEAQGYTDQIPPTIDVASKSISYEIFFIINNYVCHIRDLSSLNA